MNPSLYPMLRAFVQLNIETFILQPVLTINVELSMITSPLDVMSQTPLYRLRKSSLHSIGVFQFYFSLFMISDLQPQITLLYVAAAHFIKLTLSPRIL